MAAESSNETKQDAECSSVMFDPPVYKQRYSWVIKAVKQLNPKKVVDMGCSECGLMQKLIRAEGLSIQELTGVDIDGVVLQCNMYKLKPLMTDYLHPSREHPLTVRLYQGSVTEPDSRLGNVDLVACLELIEHLEAPVLAQFPAALFGNLNPRVVVLSTPNSDFNVLFPTLTGFRHWDHKFEWNRREFQTWCDSIAESYDYDVIYDGVGDPPAQSTQLGHCTQIAMFTRRNTRPPLSSPQNNSAADSYELFAEYRHPFVKQKLTHEEKVLMEANYYINLLAKSQATDDDEINSADGVIEVSVPLSKLMAFPCIKTLCISLEDLRATLMKTSSITFDPSGDHVIATIPCEESTSDNDDDEVCCDTQPCTSDHTDPECWD